MRTNSHFSGASLYTPKGLRKYLTRDERERFIAAAWRYPRRDMRLLCLTLAHMGCRISEALALLPTSIEAEAGFIAFPTLKRRSKATVIREVPALDDLLRELLAFVTHPRMRLWSLSRSQAWRHVKAVMHLAGITDGPYATPKGLRHGIGVHAIHSGVPLNLVQRWLGHARMTTTAIYVQVMGDEERSIAARMWGTVPPVQPGTLITSPVA